MSGTDKSLIIPKFLDTTTAGVIPESVTKTGTISSTGTVVTGTGTIFKTILQVRKGDFVWAQNQVRQVVAIYNDTRLDVDRAFVPDISGQAFKVVRSFPNLQVSIVNTGGGTATISTLNYDDQNLEPGKSISFDSKNGLTPIAYTPSGATLSITNGLVANTGNDSASPEHVILPAGQQVLTSVVATDASGSPIIAGAFSILLVSSSTYSGNVNGVALAASTTLAITAAEGKTLPAIVYTVAAGSMRIDKLV